MRKNETTTSFDIKEKVKSVIVKSVDWMRMMMAMFIIPSRMAFIFASETDIPSRTFVTIFLSSPKGDYFTRNPLNNNKHQ